MKWRGARRSAHVRDTRNFGRRAGKVAGGGGLAAVIVIGAAILFPDLRDDLLGSIEQPGPNSKGGSERTYSDDALEFAQVTVAYTEDVWGEIFASGTFKDAGGAYRPANVILFDGRVETKCGGATSAAGPFYCPADQTVYIDPSFYDVMKKDLGAPGDFAVAYVIAHEIGHHVQNISGQLGRVYSMRLQASEREANRLTVRIELQADCYAGLWAHRAEEQAGILEEGDIDEALRAANQVGDDVLQRMAGQKINEDLFTHGSAEQRKRWFMRGFKTGDPAACDTYSLPYEQL